MTNYADRALGHLERVTCDANRAQVYALLDIAAAIRETRPTSESAVNVRVVEDQLTESMTDAVRRAFGIHTSYRGDRP